VFIGGYFSGCQPVDFIQTAILTLCGQVSVVVLAVVQTPSLISAWWCKHHGRLL